MTAHVWPRVAIVALLLGAVVALFATGAYAHLTEENLRAVVARAGPFGPLLFVVMFALAELVYIPPILFLLGGPVLWPLSIALPTVYAGAVAAACTVFLTARYLITEPMKQRLHQSLPERLRRWDDRLASDGLRTVILVRLTTFMMPLVHWVLGVSRVGTRDALLGSAIGLLPGCVLFVVVGETLVNHWETARPWFFGALGLLVALQVARRLRSRRQGRGGPELASDPSTQE